MARRYKYPFDVQAATDKHSRWFNEKYGNPIRMEMKLVSTVKQRRAERENAAGTGWTPEEWNALIIKCDGKCLRCGSDTNQLVPDHIKALSQGGSHSIGNIQPLCSRCNIWKGLKTIDFRYGYSLEVA